MATAREWQEANPERVKAYRKQYYEAHRERYLRQATEYQNRNPKRTQLQYKVASANKRYPGKLSIADIRFIIERDGRICHWCGKSDLQDRDFTLEHLEPRNDKDCITIACRSCNSGKAGKYGGRIQTPTERKAKAKERRHRQYENNKERTAELARKWVAEHRDRHRKYKREYARAYRARKCAERLLA